MGRGFDAPFPYLSEGSTIDSAVRWDYVGRHAAIDNCYVTLADCPVDSRRRTEFIYPADAVSRSKCLINDVISALK